MKIKFWILILSHSDYIFVYIFVSYILTKSYAYILSEMFFFSSRDQKLEWKQINCFKLETETWCPLPDSHFWIRIIVLKDSQEQYTASMWNTTAIYSNLDAIQLTKHTDLISTSTPYTTSGHFFYVVYKTFYRGRMFERSCGAS